jgi:hypothetical protein
MSAAKEALLRRASLKEPKCKLGVVLICVKFVYQVILTVGISVTWSEIILALLWPRRSDGVH